MMNKILLSIGGVILLGVVGALYWTSNSHQETADNNKVSGAIVEPQAQSFDLMLAKRKLTPNIVTVTQGAVVRIRVNSDEVGEFHVSGYEIENDMDTDAPLEFSFAADKAGRYNFELHPKAGGEEDHDATTTAATATEEAGEDIVVGAFVVNPR